MSFKPINEKRSGRFCKKPFQLLWSRTRAKFSTLASLRLHQKILCCMGYPVHLKDI